MESSFNFIFMTDDDKKKTVCLFITLPERVKMNNNGALEHKNENAKKYFEKFCGYCVVPWDWKAPDLIKDFCNIASLQEINNVQVIFDLHGDKDAFSLSCDTLDAAALRPLFHKLKARNLDIIMAHCQGSENVRTISGKKSLNTHIKELNEFEASIGKGKNVSLYYMPKGHYANITFTKNGDIFFISSGAEKVNYNQDNSTERFYKNQNDQEPGLVAVNEGGCWYIPAEKYCKGGETNILKGIYKNYPPRCFNINVDENKEVSTALVHKPTDVVLYKEPLALKIKHELDLNLNKKNEINTTTKK